MAEPAKKFFAGRLVQHEPEDWFVDVKDPDEAPAVNLGFVRIDEWQAAQTLRLLPVESGQEALK